MAASDKGSWFNQFAFWDELEEVKTKRKIVLRKDDIDFLSDSDSDDDYSGSTYLSYKVFDLAFLQPSLSKIVVMNSCHIVMNVAPNFF